MAARGETGARMARGMGRLALGALACAVISACGSGGGTRSDAPPLNTGSPGTQNPPPTPPPPTPPPSTTPEPAIDAHLALINAGASQRSGYSGTGYAIGVVDTGVNRNHPALAGRVAANLTYVSSANDLSVDDKVGHGTTVAQLAAGRAVGRWPGGVAPGATLLSARIIQDESPEDDGSGQGNQVDGALGLKSIHEDLAARGMRIMNNSWGGLYWTQLSATAPIADEYRFFIRDRDGLVVFATGNEGQANPTDMAALPSKPGPGDSRPAADLERGWLAVAALDTATPTQLASYSNACGLARNYCLVAPGTAVFTGHTDTAGSTTYYYGSGTSYAAPLVSGAAALVWEKYPYFNNDLVRQTLLGTATDLGQPGPDDVFGYGLLNVGKAIAGPARFDWGDVAVSFAGTSTWSNDISGAGGLVKRGSGVLNLTGSNTYAGATTVQDGTLSTTGLAGATSVSDGARLEVNGGGVGGNLTNLGNTRFAGAAGSRTIAGDFVQGDSGTLEYQVGSPLAVTGTAQLGGNLRVFGVASGYVRSNRESVLNSQGALSGAFLGVAGTDGVVLDATLGYDYAAGSAWLDITRLDVPATASSLGFTATAVTAASRMEGALDGIDAGLETGQATTGSGFVGLAGEFLHTASASALSRSLESLSGQAHAAADTMTLDVVDMRRRALSEHVSSLQSGVVGAWSRSLDGRQARGIGVSEFDVGGWLVGNEVQLAPGLVSGLAFGRVDASSPGDALGDHSRDRQTQAQAYLARHWGSAYAFAQLGTGRFRRDMQRNVMLGEGRYDVGSRYQGQVLSFGLESGYRYSWGRGASLVPFLGMDYTRLERDAFSERGAEGFGLSAASSAATREQAIVGLRADQPLRLGSVALSFGSHLEWQQVLSAEGFSRDARFVGFDAWAPMPAGFSGTSGGLFGLSLDADLAGNGRLALGFDRRFGPRGDLDVMSLRYSAGF
jgi:autotransporter-associated beta strand protein